MFPATIAKRDNPRFIVGAVSIGHLFSHFYLLALPPIFPLIRDEFGLSNTELGLIISVMMVPIMLLQLPIGRLVDSIGAKRGFSIGLAVTGGATLLFGIAPTYLSILGIAAVAGVGQAFFHPSDYALLSAIGDGSNDGKIFSLHTFGGYAGFAAAPLIVGTLASRFGWRTALIVTGALGLLAGGVAMFSIADVYLEFIASTTESNDGESGGLRELVSPQIAGVFVFFMLLFMAGTGIQSFTTVFLVDYGLRELVGNYALTAFFTCSAIGVLLGGVVADRFDIHYTIIFALLLAGALTGVLSSGVLVLTGVSAAAVFGGIGSLSGVMRPARDRLVSLYAPASSSGQSFGLVFSGGSLGGLLSPILLGFVIDTTTASLSFLLIGLFFAGAAVVVLALDWVEIG